MAIGMAGRQLAAACLMLLLGCSTAAVASSFGVMPTRLDFAAGTGGVRVIQITNAETRQITLETEVVVTTPEGGQQSPGDLVVTPPIITLQAGQTTRVRVGMLTPPPKDYERAYRLYFTELPGQRDLDRSGLGVLLRVGVPIFVGSAEVKTPSRLSWMLDRSGDIAVLHVRNDGDRHAYLTGLKAQMPTGDFEPMLPSRYVYAHSDLEIPLRADRVLSFPLQLDATLLDGGTSTQVLHE